VNTGALWTVQWSDRLTPEVNIAEQISAGTGDVPASTGEDDGRAGPAFAGLTRRSMLWAAAPVALSAAFDSRYLFGSGYLEEPLYSSTVVIADNQGRVLVPPGADWSDPGSRVLRTAGQVAELRRQELAWQDRTRLRGQPGQADANACRLGLLDLRVLTLDGAPIAAWSSSWRYVWPRDSAFVVAALAVTGHADDAARILDFVQLVQSPEGIFQARYDPRTRRVPDDRGVQLDGTGWSLWGLLRWAQAIPADTRAQRLRRFTSLLDRSTAACLRLTAGGTSLPPASPDYWELSTDRVTLGNAAPFLIGLQAAAKLSAMLGDTSRAAGIRAAADRYRALITARFGPRGYPRYPDGESRDAAVTFLLPPFVDEARRDVVDAWWAAQEELRRPAGGLAPGASWRQDGTSWTPETALFALTAAGLDEQDRARSWLDWLLAHRTAAGSFSEKVLSDGAPAAAAPFAWTTATVVLTVNELAT
jgi:glucoamylase